MPPRRAKKVVKEVVVVDITDSDEDLPEFPILGSSSAKPSGAASKRKATAAESHELQRDGRSKKVRTVSNAAANAVVDVGLTVKMESIDDEPALSASVPAAVRPGAAPSKRKATAVESREPDHDGKSEKVPAVADRTVNADVDDGLTVALESIDDEPAPPVSAPATVRPSGPPSERKATAAESHEPRRDGKSKKVETGNADVDIALTVKMQSIDDEPAPPVSDPATIRPRMKNKGSRASPLPDVSHGEHKADASSSGSQNVQDSDGDHSTYSAENRKVVRDRENNVEGENPEVLSGPANEEGCDVVEAEDKLSSRMPEECATVSGPSEDDVRAAQELMPADQRDALLAKDYDLLPLLRLRFMIPFGGGSMEQIFMAEYSAVFNALQHDGNEQRLLASAVRFSTVLPFVNPARAVLSAVRLEGRKLVVQGVKGNSFEGVNAVFLTTGIITECTIVKPATSWAPLGGPPGSPVKRIRLRPFAIEYERTVAYLGTLLEIENAKGYAGPISSKGLGFSTRKDGARKVNESNSRFLASSPTKNVAGRKKMNARGSAGIFADYLTFDDDVPIYDIRHRDSFDFRPGDLRDINALPRWDPEHETDGDLEADRIVATVAYTVNTFPSGGRDTGMPAMPAVLLNIMFVLVLGVTA